MHEDYLKAVSVAVAVLMTAIAVFPHTLRDVDLMAEVIYWENWYTDEDHLAAYYTGAVVLNRIDSDESWLHLKGDKTVYDVVYAKGQYSTTKYFFTKEIPDECRQMAIDILSHGTPDVPKNVIYQATFIQGSGDWIEPINGEHFCYE